MRLEQGSICDYCKEVMNPHEKLQIRYVMTNKDRKTKCVVSALTTSVVAYDLCVPCASKVSKILEKKVFWKRNNPFDEVMKRHKSQAKEN